MKSLSVITIGALIVGLTVLGCSQQMSGQGDAGWVTLLDGANPKTLDNWNRIGDANWRAEDGVIVADKGKGGHLVSKNSTRTSRSGPSSGPITPRTAAFSSALPIPKTL